ncbi:MAG TPA: PEGA domain-containing protein [Sandaracinaceae bacterium LLY-WYZ-13_1]|nr:PEGA domain-containing protein [Sandaracinaceae bacterium LLY-WYZ-13_1]
MARRTGHGLRLAALAAGSLFALVALAASSAAAQSAAMLPPGEPPEGPSAAPELQREAIEAVARALTADDITVIPSADAQRRMVGEPFAECHELDCGANVVRSLGVDYAVLVTVWAPRGRPTNVVVTFIGPDDSVAGDAPVEGEGLVAAALSALTTARQRWQASRMGFIAVESDPPGADVTVDGRVLGQTPLRRLVPAGERTVRVSLEGYATVERTVQVAPTREHPIEVTLAAPVEEPDPPSTPRTRTEPHWASWVLGGGLAAVGVGLLVPALATGFGDAADACTEESGGVCARTPRFGAQSGVLLGVGLAAAAAGVVVLAVQPFQVTTVVTPDSATLRVRGTF